MRLNIRFRQGFPLITPTCMIGDMRQQALYSSIALVSIALLPTLSAGAAVPTQRLVRVSGPSPVSGCHVPLVDGVLYPQTEVEPNVSANPARPGNLVGV